MAVEVIEGTLEPSEPSSSKRKFGHYKVLRITVPNGQVRSLEKISAGGAILDEIRRGGQGSFYVAKVDGGMALFGVRRADGTANYSHYTNIEPIVLAGGLLGSLAGVGRFGFGLEIPWLAFIFAPILLGTWYYLRSQRLAQQRAFEADGA